MFVQPYLKLFGNITRTYTSDYIAAMKDQVFLTTAHQYSHPEQISGFTVNNNTILALVKGSPEVIALTHNLSLLWKRDFSLHWDKYVPPRISINPNGLLIGIAEINTIRLATIDGTMLFRQEHEAWASFLGANLFFVEKYVFFITSGQENDLLTMMDITTLKIISTICLPGNRENYYTFHCTPDPKVTLLEAAAGQDNCTLFLIKQASRSIEIEEIKACNDRIMGSFSPDGSLFVTAPHYEEGLEWYTFPLANRVGEISQSAIFTDINALTAAEPDTLNYQTFFVTNKLVAALTRFGRILLINTDSKCVVTELILQELEPKGYDNEGQETLDAEKILDYASELVELRLIAPNLLLALDSSGKLLCYSLSL